MPCSCCQLLLLSSAHKAKPALYGSLSLDVLCCQCQASAAAALQVLLLLLLLLFLLAWALMKLRCTGCSLMHGSLKSTGKEARPCCNLQFDSSLPPSKLYTCGQLHMLAVRMCNSSMALF
jgi:hypothetical protein